MFSLEFLLRLMMAVPDDLKTQEAYIKVVEEDQSNLRHVPDHFKTQDICYKANT